MGFRLEMGLGSIVVQLLGSIQELADGVNVEKDSDSFERHA
jgi:hypothetical protein